MAVTTGVVAEDLIAAVGVVTLQEMTTHRRCAAGTNRPQNASMRGQDPLTEVLEISGCAGCKNVGHTEHGQAQTLSSWPVAYRSAPMRLISSIAGLMATSVMWE